MNSKVCQMKNKIGNNPAIMKVLTLVVTFVMVFGCFSGIGWAADSDQYFFGKATEHSTFNKESSELKDSFYFSDSWFEKDPSSRNDELALISMQLTAAAIDGGSDSNGSVFLKSMGFSDIAFADTASSDPDACNFTHGKKTLADGRTLVAVVIQSYALDNTVKEQGWKQNFIVNGEDTASGEHFAFARAAAKVLDDIEGLGDSNTVFWVMGQSRGGALANLIAKNLGDHGKDVYAYTFEAPATVDEDQASGDYGYIHNYLCHDDIVTKVPMWGMTRYGNSYDLKTEETDENIQEELTKLGSEAAEEDVMDSEWIETDIIDYLSERIAAREDYSKEHSDSFKDPDTGENVTLTYSYQETFVDLMGVIFGSGLTGVADVIMDSVEDVEPAVIDLVKAVKLDGTDKAMPYYYSAAKKLHALLDGASEEPLGLSVKDLYALLTLAGPFAIDTEYEPIGDPTSDVMGYMSPAVNVVMCVGGMTYSHHFDTLIARLKTLAPAPEMEDIDITIAEPKAGDDVSKAPSEVEEFFDEDSFRDAGDTLWIIAEASWDTEDEELQDDCIYYLDITLETVGHTIPEDISLKLNGEAPAKGPFISYDEATGITRVTFEFEIGEPPEIEVTFDTGGKADAPEPMTVKKGTALVTKERPDISEVVTSDGSKYKFKDWYDESGTAWDDVKVYEPMTMYAKWLDYVDLIDVSFAVPSLGDKVSEATVPEDAPYYILEQNCSDPHYEDVDEISSEGEYYLSLNIALKDPDNSVFALEPDDWGYNDYIGTATVNGEEWDEPVYDGLYYGLSCDYDEDGLYMRLVYYFPVTAEDDAAYTVIKGGRQTWTKGSDQSIEFVVKRSVNDEETFKLFKEAKIDGESLTEDAYTVREGSLILNVKPAYLETLSEGDHTLTVEFEDGSAETNFRIKASEEQSEDEQTPTDGDDQPGDDDATPTDGGDDQPGDDNEPVRTGDNTDFVTWIIIMAASIMALAGIGIAKKEK